MAKCKNSVPPHTAMCLKRWAQEVRQLWKQVLVVDNSGVSNSVALLKIQSISLSTERGCRWNTHTCPDPTEISRGFRTECTKP